MRASCSIVALLVVVAVATALPPQPGAAAAQNPTGSCPATFELISIANAATRYLVPPDYTVPRDRNADQLICIKIVADKNRSHFGPAFNFGVVVLDNAFGNNADR